MDSKISLIIFNKIVTKELMITTCKDLIINTKSAASKTFPCQILFQQCPESRGQKDCAKTCASEDLECYVVDNNGFVIISENRADTGKFFGEVDGTILESLVQVWERIISSFFFGAC